MGGSHSPPSDVAYEAVFDMLPVAAFIANPAGLATFFSAGWEKQTGHRASEILADDAHALVHPDDRENVANAWALAIATLSPYRAEYRTRFADGSYRYTLSRATPLRDEAGTLVSWFGTFVDTDDIHRVEEAMAHAIDASLESARDARSRAEFAERLIDSSGDFIKLLDLSGNVISIDGRGREMAGFAEPKEGTGVPWISGWPHVHRQAVRTALATAAAGERSRFVASHEHDGIERWWDVSVSPIRGAHAEPEQLLAVARDITDVYLSHRALAHSEERYRVLSEALPGVTWTATPDGLVDRTSDAPNRLPSESRLANQWAEHVHADDLTRANVAWQKSITAGTPYEIQVRLRTLDGTFRWHLSRAHPQFDEHGAIVRWIGVSVDIDEQHRADEKREQFVRLADASDDFIVLGDLSGALTYMNAAMLQALEIESIDELLEHPRYSIFAPEDRAFFQATILPTQLREGRWHGEFRLRTFKTGTTIPILYNAFVLRDDSGEPAGLAGVSRDLRERRRVDIGMRALAETGAAMYGSLDFEGTIQNVASAVVKSFASICVVDAITSDGSIRSVAASNRGPQFARTMQRAATARNFKLNHPVWRAIKNGESTLVANIPKDWTTKNGMRDAVGDAIDELDFRSLLFVPIRSQQDGGVYGALSCSLDGHDSRGQFTIDDLRFAEEIAVRAGLAFDHARAYERERRIAVTLQEASLPRVLPALDHLYLSADYRPGNSEATIGGDWYDAFVLDDGRVAITIGDILGNGLGAAVTMGKVRQAMQSVAIVIPDPSIMLQVADRTVRAQSDDTYATAIAGIFDFTTHEFVFASAGHPGPLVRLPSGEIEDHTLGGVLLGMRDRSDAQTQTIAVPPGSMLVFFTDGLTEATRDIDEGVRRIRAAIERLAKSNEPDPAHALAEDVLGGAPATDDVAVLIAEIGPSARLDARVRGPRDRSGDRQGTLAIFSAPLADPESRGKVVTIAARLDEIVRVRRAIRSLVANADLPRETIELVELVTGELVANAVEHGSGSLIDVALRILSGSIILAVTNDGPVFERGTSDLASMIFAERGRGLALLTALGCVMTVEATDESRCTVTANISLA